MFLENFRRVPCCCSLTSVSVFHFFPRLLFAVFIVARLLIAQFNGKYSMDLPPHGAPAPSGFLFALDLAQTAAAAAQGHQADHEDIADIHFLLFGYLTFWLFDNTHSH